MLFSQYHATSVFQLLINVTVLCINKNCFLVTAKSTYLSVCQARKKRSRGSSTSNTRNNLPKTHKDEMLEDAEHAWKGKRICS